MSKFVVYSDNAIEAAWFKNLHPSFENLDSKDILGRGRNPPVVENLIQYDRPDIILTDGSKALLVIEKTREVPTGHNVGQRVARLVKAVENQIPTIKFFPFDAKKHGAYSGICNLNIRLILAFDKMWDIHKCPIIALNWITDSDGELIDDGSEDDEIKSVIKDFVASGFNINCSRFTSVRKQMDLDYKRRLAQRHQYGDPPPSVTFNQTSDFLNTLGFNVDQSDKISLLKHKESLVYLIGMTEDKCKRQDPYTGTQFIYDYAYCRTGARPADKNRNLILHFPNLKKSVWDRKNPNDPNSKSCNWYLVANAFIFSDGITVLR
jgi:hypothetical protein